MNQFRDFKNAVKEIEDNPNPDPEQAFVQLERVINLQDTINYLNNYCDSSDSFSEHFISDKGKSSTKYVKYAGKVTEKSVYNYTWVRSVAKTVSSNKIIILFFLTFPRSRIYFIFSSM